MYIVADGNQDVIQLNVINGTHWLHLGGDVEDFIAVLGKPPATSSDTTLHDALLKLNSVRYFNVVIIIE